MRSPERRRMRFVAALLKGGSARVCEGRAAIAAMLERTAPVSRPGNFWIEGDAETTGAITEAWFSFETNVARGKGHVRLKDGKCWTLLTTMVELKGYEERKGPKRIMGAEHGVAKNRKNWLQLKQEEEARLGLTEQPYCLIVGGGQGGIALGARLSATDWVEGGWAIDDSVALTKELKQAGIEAYLAEVQKQVDAFVADRGVQW